MRHPDVLIVGGQRCGTTWLCEMLRQYPEIWLPGSLKPEPKTYLPESGGPYRGVPRDRVLVEKTTRYLAEPGVPVRVRAVASKTKIIVLERDPVRRAWSHWNYSTQEGVETRPFAEALAVEVLAEGEDRHKRAYIGNGLFGEHLRRWMRYIAARQIYVGRASDPYLFADLERFLGLEPRDLEDPGPINAGPDVGIESAGGVGGWLPRLFEPDQALFCRLKEKCW